MDVRVVYDSSDRTVTVVEQHPGAWKPAGTFTVGDTGAWKTVTFRVEDALFTQRCNGHDLRVEVQGDRDITLGAMRITKVQRDG